MLTQERRLQAIQQLRQAADVIRAGRWTQFTRRDRAGNMCALGALELDSATGARMYAERHRLIEIGALGRMIPSAFNETHRLGNPIAWRIANWNNDDEQTAENVAAAMEMAALCLEQDARDTRPQADVEATNIDAVDRGRGMTHEPTTRVADSSDSEKVAVVCETTA